MSLISGTYQELTVERDSPFGYFLSDGKEDVLLHYSEMENQTITIGQKLNVFLFNDHKGRIAATLEQPKICLDEVDFLEVKDYQGKMGYFLDNGLDKQVLLPIAELPEEKEIWPANGDKLLVKLGHDKQNRLLTFLVKDDTQIQSYIAKQGTNDQVVKTYKKNEFMKGIVIRHLTVGAHLYLENHQIGFIHKSEQLHELRLGQEIEARITYIRDDGSVNLSMKPLKEFSRLDDSEKLLHILEQRRGAMPYWDKTPPDIIMKQFNLSKAAFKRALGKLLKDGLIYQEDGWTYIKKQEDNKKPSHS